MVNIKDAVIRFPAFGAFAAKLCYERKLSRPVSWMFELLIALSIPVFVPAIGRTKSVLCFLPAMLARHSATPSSREVTGIAAKFPVALFDLVRLNLECSITVVADAFNLSVFSHIFHHYILNNGVLYPEYCAIAERRIAQQVLELEAV